MRCDFSVSYLQCRVALGGLKCNIVNLYEEVSGLLKTNFVQTQRMLNGLVSGDSHNKEGVDFIRSTSHMKLGRNYRI